MNEGATMEVVELAEEVRKKEVERRRECEEEIISSIRELYILTEEFGVANIETGETVPGKFQTLVKVALDRIAFEVAENKK